MSFSQSEVLNGLIKSTENLENIHIQNKSQKFYAVTNYKGEFQIKAKLRDTLTFTSVQHVPKQIIVNQNHLDTHRVVITLDSEINKLDTVVIGNILTGDLYSDIGSVKGEPQINFYDVGIPGYKGKPKTMNQRRLQEASELKPTAGGSLGGLGGSLSLTAILNAISGRTKKLKKRVEIETILEYTMKLKGKFSKDLFAENPLPENYIMGFFYFASEDESFLDICKSKNDLLIFEFLLKKLKVYKENLNFED